MDKAQDQKLKWHEVFDDGTITIFAANYASGVLLSFNADMCSLQFVPGYRVFKQEGDMDSARLARREPR